MTARPTSILITGASSGLGLALATAHAAPGVTLFLSALDADALAAAARLCRERGAEVDSCTLDVRAREPMTNWVRRCDARKPLDRVIANAGISASSSGADGEDEDVTRTIFATNVDGVLNTVFPAATAMCSRRRGQIALVSSLAGYRGTRRSAAYCASKAAVRVLGEGLRARLAPDGVRVSVICPGLLAVGQTASRHERSPWQLDADRAVRVILRGLARDRGLIGVPWVMACGARWTAALPDGLLAWFLRRFGAGG